MLGVIQISVVPPNAIGCIVPAHLPHAHSRHLTGAAAQHAAVADRFAREIVGFGKHHQRSRRLSGNPLGRLSSLFTV